MSLLAVVELEHPDLLLASTIRAQSELEFELEYQTVVDPEYPVAFFSATGDCFGGIEETLADDPTVVDPLVVSSFEGRRVFRVRLNGRKKLLSPTFAELGARVLAARSTDRGWRLRLALPDRDALVAVREFCESEEVTFRLARLSRLEGDATAGTDLTDAQAEIIRLAYERGYFEQPRGTSLRELADELNISPTAASGRLRRGLARLVEEAGVVEE